MNLLQDIESFFSHSGSGSQTLSNICVRDAVEVVKKAVAMSHINVHLWEAFVKDVETDWSTLRNTSDQTLINNAHSYLAAGQYEKAAVNILYLIYQKLEPEVTAPPGVSPVLVAGNDAVIKNVSLAYNLDNMIGNDDAVIKNVSFSVDSNMKVTDTAATSTHYVEDGITEMVHPAAGQ